jgi:hypothetical protein
MYTHFQLPLQPIQTKLLTGTWMLLQAKLIKLPGQTDSILHLPVTNKTRGEHNETSTLWTPQIVTAIVPHSASQVFKTDPIVYQQ